MGGLGQLLEEKEPGLQVQRRGMQAVQTANIKVQPEICEECIQCAK